MSSRSSVATAAIPWSKVRCITAYFFKGIATLTLAMTRKFNCHCEGAKRPRQSPRITDNAIVQGDRHACARDDTVIQPSLRGSETTKQSPGRVEVYGVYAPHFTPTDCRGTSCLAMTTSRAMVRWDISLTLSTTCLIYGRGRASNPARKTFIRFSR